MAVTQESRQFVLFRLGDEEYGLPILSVRCVICYMEPTPVPLAPRGIEGVIDLRGQLIPVVDISMRLLAREFEPEPRSRIVVAEGDSGLVGLAVDSAGEVVSILASDIRPASKETLPVAAAEAYEGVASIEDRFILLLDPAKALLETEFMPPVAEDGDGDN